MPPMVKKAKAKGRGRKRPARVVPYKRVRGHGAYTYGDKARMGPFERIGRSLGGVLGGAYLGHGGGKIGAKLGSYLHYIGKIFGSGDYVTAANQVKHNVLVSDTQIPQFGSSNNTVHIRHREFLGDVISSNVAGQFQLTSFSINPGLEASFPWLSQVCGASFQQYRINGMVFEFRSMSADALTSNNTALGTVVMATDYDSKDSPFTTKAQMENTEFGVSCKPSSCMIHAIECARNQTSVSELYIRANSVPTGADIRLYDMGTFYIATQGFQGTDVNCGELWVSYDITLFKAIQQPPGFIIPTAHYQLDPTSIHGGDLCVPLANNSGSDTIGLTLNNAQVFFPLSMPQGSVWQVQYGAQGAGTTGSGTIAGTPLNGMNAAPSIFLNDGTNALCQYGISTLDAITQQGVSALYTYDGSGTVASPPNIMFQLTGGNKLSSYSSGDLFVSMISSKVT